MSGQGCANYWKWWTWPLDEALTSELRFTCALAYESLDLLITTAESSWCVMRCSVLQNSQVVALVYESSDLLITTAESSWCATWCTVTWKFIIVALVLVDPTHGHLTCMSTSPSCMDALQPNCIVATWVTHGRGNEALKPCSMPLVRIIYTSSNQTIYKKIKEYSPSFFTL